MIGHNSPPAHEAHAMNIEELFALANGIPAIETAEQEAAADQLLDDLRKARKAADESRKAEAKPFDDGKAAVQERYKPILSCADIATDAVKALLTPYRAAQKAKADAEAARLRKEAERAAQAAQEALQSDDLEDRLAAEQAIKDARIATIQANKIDRAATGLRTSWEAEITDPRAALNAMLKSQPERFMALIQDIANELARTTREKVPGVLYHERKKAA